MTRVTDIFAGARPISFEMFPPKGDLTLEEARRVAADFAPLAPDFVSVTYSAAGSGNSLATSEVASMIQSEHGIPSVVHLTCINATEQTLASSIADLRARGIENVLALRGDCVAGVQPGRFQYAKDLIPRLVEAGFCVGAAAYPEGHIECENFAESIEHLRQKQDAGAQFFVTQLFFDNGLFYRFRDAAAAAGIFAPMTCGIMPFLGKAQIQRMVFMCGASLPSPIIKLLAKYEDSPEDLRRAGIEYACAQLEDLDAHGAAGLHVYTMNHTDIASACISAVRHTRG